MCRNGGQKWIDPDAGSVTARSPEEWSSATREEVFLEIPGLQTIVEEEEEESFLKEEEEEDGEEAAAAVVPDRSG